MTLLESPPGVGRSAVIEPGGAVAEAQPAPPRTTRRWWRMARLAALGVALVVLLPQLGQAPATWHALARARWSWLLLVALASAATYLMAAVAVMGSTGLRLGLGRTWSVQVAAAFANRLAPAGVGGMLTNVRYLQGAGAERASACSSVALNSLAGFAVHVVAVAAALPLVGLGGGLRWPSAPDLPEQWPLVLVVVGVLGAALAARQGQLLGGRLVSSARTATANLRAVASEPAKLVALLAGSAGVTVAYAVGLVAAVHAFGGAVGLTGVVTVYLGASAVGAATPLPGGLGAFEATVAVGLTGAGMPAGAAVAAVLAYRLITYWAPVVPGAWLYRRLRSSATI